MSLYSEVVPLVACPRCGQDAIPMSAQPQKAVESDDRRNLIVGVQYNAYCHAPGCRQMWFRCLVDEEMNRGDFDAMQALLADVSDGSVFGHLRNAGRQIQTRKVSCAE